jgi:membrane protein
MKPKIKKLLRVFYDAGYHTVHHDGIEHAGYLAFLAIIAIFPGLIFLLSFASDIGNLQVVTSFITEIEKFLPQSVMEVIKPTINELVSGPPHGIITFAIIGITWSASGAVEGVRTILNRAYGVKNPPHYIFRRTLSILEFIFFIMLIVIAMLLITIIPAIIGLLESVLSKQLITPAIEKLKYFISFIFLFIGIALSYYVLPNIKQKFSQIITGAILCASLWLITAFLFTNYIAYYHKLNTIYGSLAGIVITLFFFYILSLVYIFCAEFNYIHQKQKGNKIEEKE